MKRGRDSRRSAYFLRIERKVFNLDESSDAFSGALAGAVDMVAQCTEDQRKERRSRCHRPAGGKEVEKKRRERERERHTWWREWNR